MHIGPAELIALAHGRQITPALRRLASRENAKHAAQPSVPRPRIHSPAEDPFYQDNLRRLRQLQNKPCRLCGEPLEFTGISLVCINAHGWRNARAAEDDHALPGFPADDED